ncbi:Xanthine/uracil/vitamin C permease [Gilbertella persicaria]|uniref:Xanthine/uracil/vitamin C permease n=1 Tax=Gilbertella persicaria TaxID=101096 RepID=UPI00221F70C1|nr:Xanthine/uracil/vitamin C permease [Gilbertella persicaria]KAI8078963.1 Xanthine/uracil/vitamin C permease [Gilbertella persicaria]
MPRIPFGKSKKKTEAPLFYGPNDVPPVFVAILMGVQHFLAVIAGIITPTIILSGPGSNNLNLDEETRQFMVSVSLIVSGIMSIFQIVRFKIPKTRYYFGIGLLQIAGVAFANMPASQALVSNMYKNGRCPTTVLEDGTINYLPCPDAFGAILGTQMLCALLNICISFLPHRVLRKLFPKIVTGTVLVVIGTSLISTAMKNWAGGSGPCMDRPSSGEYVLCPDIHAPNPQAWGSPVNFGIGAAVFGFIILIELVGSVFMKNVSVILGLIVGIVITGALGMLDNSSITSAPSVTFIWVKTFKYSIYPPAILPFLFTCLDMMIECLGDLTAASDVSGLPIEGKAFEERSQGGLLCDGVSIVLSGLCSTMGVITYSNNNGVIAVTRCASRTAGLVCAGLLILCGIFSKISAAFLSIPDPVIGGMTLFIFSSVGTSGVRILGYLDWTRRDRVIVASALAIGLGVSVVPDWFSYVMPKSTNEAAQGFYDSINTIVETGYIMTGLIAILLNWILPKDLPELTLHRSQSGHSRIYRDEEKNPSQ